MDVSRFEKSRCADAEGAGCVFLALKEQHLRVALHATRPSSLSVTDCVVCVIHVDMATYTPVMPQFSH